MEILTQEEIPVNIKFNNEEFDKYLDNDNDNDTEKAINTYLIDGGYIQPLDRFDMCGFSWSREDNLGTARGFIVRERNL